MNPIDDMFRKGLDERSGEVPADMWSRVQAGQFTPSPEGAELDKLFADGLKDHAGQVPTDMWSRIAATGLPATAAVDQVFSDGLKDRVGDVPAGMWDKIWRARTAAPGATARRWASAAAVILLLLLAGWWLLPNASGVDLVNTGPETTDEVVAKPVVITDKTTEGGILKTNTSASEGLVVGDVHQSNPEGRDIAESKDVHIRLSNTEENNVALSGDGDAYLSNTEGQEAVESKDVHIRLSNTEENNVALSGDGDAYLSNTEGQEAVESKDVYIRLSNLKSATASLPISSIPSLITYKTAPTEIKVKGRYRPKPSNDRAFRAAPRHRFQTELLFGAAYADQQFTPATGADRPLSDVREVSEFPELSYQVSLRGAYNLNERLVFLGGLTYAEIRNQFEYERTVTGATSLIVTTNSIRMLEAPLLLGYRMPGRRMQVSLNAGPVVNISTRARGRFLDPDAPQPLDLATEGNYRRNVGVGFMTSLSTTYQIGKKEPFVLLVEPFFKAYPTAFTTKGAPLKETYWVAGLQLGVRKGF